MRSWLLLPRGNTLCCLGLLLLACAAGPAAAFNFENVDRRAKQLADKPYKAPEVKVPKALSALNYDQLRMIRFKTDRSVWRPLGLPFELQFFHPGFLFKDVVKINLVSSGTAKAFPFDPSSFTYPKLDADPKTFKELNYAGFRIHYPVNKPEYKDEVAVFLGASYFRAVGKGQVYGLSSRGLAIDTAEMSGEEFPAFREFWIEQPDPKDDSITVHALLDSRRAAGAYRFTIHPGVTTTMDVKARLYLRQAVGKLGLAPLNSMYFFGSNQPATIEDYRPEVHDSDGLSIAGGDGEWIWRPLVNPKRLLVTSFTENSPKGFGLMQRQREFSHYEDLETHYDWRPSAWVEPLNDWGPGRVELVQIPTADELNDNIVAYWVPAKPPEPHQPFDWTYRVHWQMTKETAPPSARVTQTRRQLIDDRALFVVDYEGPALKELGPDAKIDAIVSSDAHAEITESHAVRNDVTGGWRIAMQVTRKDKDQPIELRAFLKGEKGALSETWSYVWPPP